MEISSIKYLGYCQKCGVTFKMEVILKIGKCPACHTLFNPVALAEAKLRLSSKK